MIVHRTSLAGLTVLETLPVQDERGRFVRIFCEQDYGAIRPGLHWPQINLSQSSRMGTVRGMHFQHPPSAEAKLIRCLRGRVFDVTVDLRVGSPTFLRWHAVELSEDGPMQVFIPEGFAHGFQALTDDAQLLYLHTASWSREHEGRLRYNDPALAIDWPLPVTQVSDKDRDAPLIDDSFTGVRA
jgi:dTDP-4-dehydrorhamnose 3,5-epimerase